LPKWKGKLMTKAVRAQLVKSVLTSIMTYHATVFPLPKWLIKKIHKLRRNFFWKGEEGEGNRDGICLVKWDLVYRPKELGGLDFHDLVHFGRALHHRWLWYHWMDDERSWQGMALPCDEDDQALFQASPEIKLGNGRNAIFWHNKWLNSLVLKNIAPSLYRKAHFKKRTVVKELLNNSWMLPARHNSSMQEFLEFIEMLSLLKTVTLMDEVKDSLIWKWTPSGEYTTASAYKIQF
jgi:hypothetical protein